MPLLVSIIYKAFQHWAACIETFSARRQPTSEREVVPLLMVKRRTTLHSPFKAAFMNQLAASTYSQHLRMYYLSQKKKVYICIIKKDKASLTLYMHNHSTVEIMYSSTRCETLREEACISTPSVSLQWRKRRRRIKSFRYTSEMGFCESF